MSNEIYRILDANVNRSREAFRVIEEYLRFVRDDPALSGRTKRLRHRLKEIADTAGQENLLAARASQTDVGKDIASPAQAGKDRAEAIVTASCKRLQEALRNLEEYGNIINNRIALLAGKLRFDAYQLEKDLMLATNPRRAFQPVSLYVLIGSDLCPANRIVSLTAELLQAGVDCIQLREKRLTDRQKLKLAAELADLCRSQGQDKVFIVNDRPDIANAARAHGVHLGQHDLPIETARSILPHAVIGLSTHTLDQVRRAIDQDPTYIAIGPAFQTTTKPHEPVAGIQFISDAAKLIDQAGIPAVAIGGINQSNIDQILKLGIKRIAVASAILNADDPAASVQTLKQQLKLEHT